MTPKYLYKIVSIEDWQQSQSQKTVELGAIDTEFIHLATKEQVKHVLEKFWSDKADPLVLKLDANQLHGRLVYETNPGGKTKYYHLYDGWIPIKAVIDVKKR